MFHPTRTGWESVPIVLKDNKKTLKMYSHRVTATQAKMANKPKYDDYNTDYDYNSQQTLIKVRSQFEEIQPGYGYNSKAGTIEMPIGRLTLTTRTPTKPPPSKYFGSSPIPRPSPRDPITGQRIDLIPSAAKAHSPISSQHGNGQGHGNKYGGGYGHGGGHGHGSGYGHGGGSNDKYDQKQDQFRYYRLRDRSPSWSSYSESSDEDDYKHHRRHRRQQRQHIRSIQFDDSLSPKSHSTPKMRRRSGEESRYCRQGQGGGYEHQQCTSPIRPKHDRHLANGGVTNKGGSTLVGLGEEARKEEKCKIWEVEMDSLSLKRRKNKFSTSVEHSPSGQFNHPLNSLNASPSTNSSKITVRPPLRSLNTSVGSERSLG